MTTVNHVFSAFSFIAFILVSLPFAWHLEAWNTATCLYIFWVSISNLAFFINSVVWDGNVVNWSPVWCDISGRISLATNIAIPATCLCIQRRLYRSVLNTNVGLPIRAERRRLIIIDMMIGLGIPILNITLAYVVQEQRYEIFEDFGCRIPLLNTSVGTALIPASKLSISLISGAYGLINLYHMWIKRRTIRTMLGSSTGGLNFSRYARLLLLSGIDLLITIPFNIWVFNTWFPVSPWQSWTAIHAGFSHVYTFPVTIWRENSATRASLEGTRWIGVVYAFVFFALFGFTDEAIGDYAFAFQSVSKKLRYKTESSDSSAPGVPEHWNSQPGDSICSSDVALGVFSETQCFSADKPKPFGSTGEKNMTTIVGLGVPDTKCTRLHNDAHYTSPNARGS